MGLVKDLEHYLLECLQEECIEVAKDICKAQRFGLDDVYAKRPELGSNRDRIVRELNDLMGAVELLVAQGIIPDRWEDRKLIHDKKEKVWHYARFAAMKGELDARSIPVNRRTVPFAAVGTDPSPGTKDAASPSQD